jgi:subtilase family serine protease
MSLRFRFVPVLAFFCASLFAGGAAFAQRDAFRPTRRLISSAVDERSLVSLPGNTRPEAVLANDRGRVDDSLLIPHMQLQLRLPPEKLQELEQRIQDLQNPTSPNYHTWLTSEQFRQEFSPAPEDAGAITTWLESQGFAVHVIYPQSIDFSGTAGQVRQAFHSEIHNFEAGGARHFANASDPMIPAAFASAVAGVAALNDFMPRPLSHPRANYTVGSVSDLVVPADLATIYNFNPLFARGVSGQGQTIVVVEDTDVFSAADWSTFRATLGLSPYSSGSFQQIHPAPPSGTNNCSDPGVNGDDAEAILDAEWATAGAPNAAVVLASCADTTNFGGFIALQNLLNESSTPPSIVSISYGESEPQLGAAANAYINSLYMQAAAEGVSIFVSSGDEGAASTDANLSYATHGVAVSGFTSTPYNVSVGGTDFGDSFSGSNNIYWNASNTSAFGSAKSYVPEIPWNDSCASSLIASYHGFGTSYGSGGFCNSSTGTASFLTTVAASGGPSGCATGNPATSGVVGGSCTGYAKPAWQAVAGNPGDGVRDIPDLALFAANGVWGHYYVVCYSDTSRGGSSCGGSPNTWSGFGGTSVAAPIMAAMQSLVNQVNGSSAGNPNPIYYALASAEYGSSGNSACNSSLGAGVASTCVFYDVTQGDNDVNCRGSRSCYTPSGTYGVLSTSNSQFQAAYAAGTGWDFATGIGTVNANNLVNNWPKPPAITSAATAAFTIGTPGTFTVRATGTPLPALTEFGNLPSGITFNSSTGVLGGTAGTGTAGSYTISFTASNGVGVNATQSFTLTVNNPSGSSGTTAAFIFAA